MSKKEAATKKQSNSNKAVSATPEAETQPKFEAYPAVDTILKHPGGRPKIELDAKAAYIFGYFRATHETMAAIQGCSCDTIRRAMQDDESEFCQAYKKGFSALRMKLSEAQVKTALEGNATLLIWLGKQYLGQADKIAEEVPNQPLTVRLIPHKQADDTE